VSAEELRRYELVLPTVTQRVGQEIEHLLSLQPGAGCIAALQLLRLHPRDAAGDRHDTTGMWLRGILPDEYGVRPESMRWLTFEDAYVAEAEDPPWAERAPAGQDLLAMLRAGELDAVIVGNDVPDDTNLRTVFPDPAAAGAAFLRRHGFVPVNHMVVVRRELADGGPDLLVELLRLFQDAKAAAPLRDDKVDPLPAGRVASRPAIELASRYAYEQGLLPRPLDADEVWEGLPDEVV
jgi:4,5-dihydroxyphthalate decarboxylase